MHNVLKIHKRIECVKKWRYVRLNRNEIKKLLWLWLQVSKIFWL